jgi:nucleotide-binding universal stress UspA family protein
MAHNGFPPIVIGVDGSAGCAAALDWAAGEAALRGCALEAVTVASPGDGLADPAAAQVRAAAIRHPSIHL